MKKFDLSLARSGAEVCTKKGEKVRILAFDRSSADFPIVALIRNIQVCCYTLQGRYYKNRDSDKDLMML